MGVGNPPPPDAAEDASVSSTYARLRRAWLNERCAPALLPYEGQLAESAAEHVEMALAELEERRAAAAEAAAAGRQVGTAADEMGNTLRTMEIDRVRCAGRGEEARGRARVRRADTPRTAPSIGRYLLRSYLRTRLYKLEMYALHTLFTDGAEELLSEREKKYLEGFSRLQEQLCTDMVLKHLPGQFRSLQQQDTMEDDPAKQYDMVPHPDLDTHVFVRVLRDLGNVNVDDSYNPINMQRGDQFVVRYRPVMGYVATGDVELV